MYWKTKYNKDYTYRYVLFMYNGKVLNYKII